MRRRTQNTSKGALAGFASWLLVFISRNRGRLTRILVATFLFSRAISLMSFPIFNDESIYLQYSQLIASNFEKFKFISINNTFADWKPPLQYWLGALFIKLSENPLAAGRFVSLLVSLLGFWGIYFFVSRAYDSTTAVWASFLYLLCPPVLMYNNQFVAETYVFSFAANYYAFLLAALQAETKGQRARDFTAGNFRPCHVTVQTIRGTVSLFLAPCCIHSRCYEIRTMEEICY